MRMREDAHGASFYHNLLLIYLIQLNMQKRAAMRMREDAHRASFRRQFVGQEVLNKIAAKPVTTK